jgi:CDGSH-type Zn-finger protein
VSGGPLYVRGHIRLMSADGGLIADETRLTLCRCGRSSHKPFGDNSHRTAGPGGSPSIFAVR